ncbi:flagellar hook-associated protein FlgK [Yersinia enterocolitica]
MNFTKIALSGMQAAQANLSAASMNLANIKTVGYTRQRVEQSAIGVAGNDSYSAGNGVNVDAFKRITEKYLVSEEWKETSNHKYFTSSQNYFTKLENSIGNETSGLAAGMREFFNGLKAATSEPTSSAYREQVINQAKSLALNMSHFNESIQDQKKVIAGQRDAMVSQINGLTSSIHEYNQKIVKLSFGNANTSALQDSRDEQVKKLSEFVDIRVTETASGSYNIAMKNGLPLISDQSVAQLGVNAASASPQIDLILSGNNYAIDMSCGAGLGAINDYETGVLKQTEDAVVGMAEQLAENINKQLDSGYDLNNAKGKALFNFDINNPDHMLTVTDINARELAFSAKTNVVGDAGNLHSLIALKDKAIALPSIGNTSFEEVGARLVGLVAFAKNSNQQAITRTKNMLDIAQQNRESVSGVNRNEEEVSILEYSNLSRSNMKVIATGEQLFSDLLALFR